MKAPDQQAMREQFEIERAALREQIATMNVASEEDSTDYSAGQHPADGATDLFLREQNISLRSNAETLIDQIDAAIERLDNGSYGICARCGNPIDPARLEALPYAARCISCQAIVEQEDALQGPAGE